MAPYRARKVMYYTDERFKDHSSKAPPDSERRRRGELLPAREPSDWETLSPPPAAPPAALAPPSGGFAPEPEVSHANPTARRGAAPTVSHAKQPEEAEALGAFAAFYGAEEHHQPEPAPEPETAPPAPLAGDDELPL